MREAGLVPAVLDVRDETRNENEVDGAIPQHRVGDADVAALCVSDLRGFHRRTFSSIRSPSSDSADTVGGRASFYRQRRAAERVEVAARSDELLAAQGLIRVSAEPRVLDGSFGHVLDDQIVSPCSQLRMVVLGSEAPPARRGVDTIIVPS
jgi:hypothetical protein